MRSSLSEARAARDTYLETLDRIRTVGADANVSLKLTQMGLEIDERVCVENLRAIIARARSYGTFVRIDMEQSAYTENTLQLFKRTFHPEFGNVVGVVLQSYLRRTERDVEEMIALGARVRLCKGAYQEPATVAFPDKRDVDTTYVACMERLLLRGTYPGIATHDARIIEHAKTFPRGKGIPPARFEFPTLYGVRRDLQLALRRQGFNVRVYVPLNPWRRSASCRRSEEHTSELQSRFDLVCRLLLEKKNRVASRVARSGH